MLVNSKYGFVTVLDTNISSHFCTWLFQPRCHAVCLEARYRTRTGAAVILRCSLPSSSNLMLLFGCLGFGVSAPNMSALWGRESRLLNTKQLNFLLSRVILRRNFKDLLTIWHADERLQLQKVVQMLLHESLGGQAEQNCKASWWVFNPQCENINCSLVKFLRIASLVPIWGSQGEFSCEVQDGRDG
jgi:hypothetical protein